MIYGHELRALQLLLQAFAQEKGVDAAQELLLRCLSSPVSDAEASSRVTTEAASAQLPPSSPWSLPRGGPSPALQATAQRRRCWADFSSDEDEDEGGASSGAHTSAGAPWNVRGEHQRG